MRLTSMLPGLLILLALPAGASTTRPLLPLPTGAGAKRTAAPPDSDHFTFVLTGDNRAAGRAVPMPPSLDRICTEIGLLQPAFTLWTGDAIYGSEETIPEAGAEYTEFLSSAAKTRTPVYNAPGNHEIFDRPEMEALYQKRMGVLYGSFDYGNSHFIALNTEEIGLNGGIGKRQYDWLAADLEANRGVAHTFVFMHHPVFPKPGEKEGWSDASMRDAVHKLFVTYGVKTVFSGHEHLYYHGVHDGIDYIISGGAGAPSDASPIDGGFQHYVVVDVDGDKVSLRILQPWRLFVAKAESGSGDSKSWIASNYNNDDVDISLEIPQNDATGKSPTASVIYKGKSKPVNIQIVPSSHPGVVTIRLKVPAHRTATISSGGK